MIIIVTKIIKFRLTVKPKFSLLAEGVLCGYFILSLCFQDSRASSKESNTRTVL